MEKLQEAQLEELKYLQVDLVDGIIALLDEYEMGISAAGLFDKTFTNVTFRIDTVEYETHIDHSRSIMQGRRGWILKGLKRMKQAAKNADALFQNLPDGRFSDSPDDDFIYPME